MIKKYKNIAILSAIILALGFSFSSVEAYTLNNDSADYDTLRVGNVTRNPNTTSADWGTSVYAYPGDTLSLAIYYHNSSYYTARNLRVSLTPKTSGSSKRHVFQTKVWADNFSTTYGEVVVNLSEAKAIEYISDSVKWRANQSVYGSRSLLNNQNGEQVFNSNGLNLGDIEPGWNTQGNVMVGFRVKETPTYNPPVTPSIVSVTTLSAGSITKNSAILNGSVSVSVDTSVETWFEWGSSYSLGNKTSSKSIGTSYRAAAFSSSLYNLSSATTYYYRAVVKLGSQVYYGNILSFKTTYATSSYTPPSTTPVKSYDCNTCNFSVNCNTCNFNCDNCSGSSGDSIRSGLKTLILEKEIRNISRSGGTLLSSDALRGDRLSFVLRVKNSGAENLNNVEIRDNVPQYLFLVNEYLNNAGNGDQKAIVWNLGTLAPGESKEVSYEVVVDSRVDKGNVIKSGGLATVAYANDLSVFTNSNEVGVRIFDNEENLSNTVGASNVAAAGVVSVSVKSLVTWGLVLVGLILVWFLGRAYTKYKLENRAPNIY